MKALLIIVVISIIYLLVDCLLKVASKDTTSLESRRKRE